MASASHQLNGTPLPAFERTALSGEKIRTGGSFEHVVVVKFFATYCEPCVRTLPAAERVHHDKPEVFFVGIVEDDTEAMARALAERHHLTFPVLFDRDNVLAGRFRVKTMPIIFVADKQGTIRWIGDETMTDEQLRAAIDNLEH